MKMKIKKKILDKGFIELLATLGTDLTVVNAARVSFGKRKEKFDEKDKKLIKYLIEHKHYSPFRHVMVQFHLKAPEFVMRQWYKHVVGIETTSSYPTKDHGWNEISGRYVKYAVDDIYVPKVWRKQSEDNKQASKGFLTGHDRKRAIAEFKKTINQIQHGYDVLLALGVAKEEARILLPLNIYTEVYWTASFQAIMNFIELRNNDHAQWEIREYAQALEDIMLKEFPIITSIWITNLGK